MRPEPRHLGCAAAVAVAAAVTAVASAAPANPPRVVEYAVALDVTQTTSWTAHGSYAWCASSSQRLPFDGSGQATVHLALSAGSQAGLVPGRAASFAAVPGGTVERSGSLVEHDGAVTSRPSGCGPLTDGDVAEDTGGCGTKTSSVEVAVGGSPTMLGSRPSRLVPGGCPWITDLHGDGSNDPLPSVLRHAEARDGLVPVALAGLRIPAPPAFAPTSATGTATQSWQAAVPGGTLDVATTIQARARIALLPAIEPGRSLAGIRLGETLAALKRWSASYGGIAASDDGDLVDGDHRWEWSLEVTVPYPDAHGNHLVENVWVSAPAGGARSSPAHRIVVTHRPPPPTAVVTRIESVSSTEVTPQGIGSGSTLADARRAYPRGHLLVFGAPIAWLLDGPGRRRTAFMVYRGVVQSVQLGCRQTDPRERGAPVDDAALC